MLKNASNTYKVSNDFLFSQFLDFSWNLDLFQKRFYNIDRGFKRVGK